MGRHSLLTEVIKASCCNQRRPISYEDFLLMVSRNPEVATRDIFQTVHQMILEFVIPQEEDDFPQDDPESISFINYDCSALFERGHRNPFFADLLLANRLVNRFHVSGGQQNRLFLFMGPHGCGKSTLINNLLESLERYVNNGRGATYEVIWRLEAQKINPNLDEEENAVLEVPCPSHDHPLFFIPKENRSKVLGSIIKDEGLLAELVSRKEYEWLFQGTPCAICTQIFNALQNRLSVEEVFKMLFVRTYEFNRRIGQGITVFGPQDDEPRRLDITLPVLQEQLDRLFGAGAVRYMYSRYAPTNRGVFVIMDVKGQNINRFNRLHGILSEGLVKVGGEVEEAVSTLFIAIGNPEDFDEDGKNKKKKNSLTLDMSFQDRMIRIPTNYTLDYEVEEKIWRGAYGDQIAEAFLPGVLQNFAKIIIASRMNPESKAIKKWIKNPEEYLDTCDEDLLLLRMELYKNRKPKYLRPEDLKSFRKAIRRQLIQEADEEGKSGFSGRESLRLFYEFFSAYHREGRLITMGMVCEFFEKLVERHSQYKEYLPSGFLEAITQLYDYQVFQEVQEAMYDYNEERIRKDIINYMVATTKRVGEKVKVPYTGESFVVKESFLDEIEGIILGMNARPAARKEFRAEQKERFAAQTLYAEMQIDGKSIEETEQFKELYERFVSNLKEAVLDPFVNNINFGNAIRAYGTDEYKKVDERIRKNVDRLINNLCTKFGYTEQGAKEICLYVLEHNLVERYS